MTRCMYCDNDRNTPTIHPACYQEWERRRASNKCTRCGKNDAAGTNVWCSQCDFNSNYEDYPGVLT